MDEKITEGYIILAGLVVAGVVRQYENALKRNCKPKIRYYENWLLSDYGQRLSLDNGALIIEKARKEVEKCKHFQ